MKICVLQADYSTTHVDYKNYDPPRDLTALRPSDTVDHVFLNKLTTYKQLKGLANKNYDIFINLCEGYLEWEVPSIDVINTLDLLNLPYTGPSAILYDPPKSLMKYVAYCADVKTPNSVVVNGLDTLESDIKHLTFPLFVKPAKAGDSLGIDDASFVKTLSELKVKINALITDYEDIMIEEYVDGREFTVLVAANADDKNCRVFTPVEYVFPENRRFKTYALKTSELHTDTNVPCKDPSVKKALEAASVQIFKVFGGVGYARLDFRMDAKNVLYFLEINFTCSVFYEDGYEGSADYILKYDETGKAGFLDHIIQEGIARHRKKQKKHVVKGNGVSGFGIFANQFILKNTIVFKGEGQAHRIISKNYVNTRWDEKEKDDFKHYAYPIGRNVYILWDENPMNWAPQNHSCNPNTFYKGLDVIALCEITEGEELTLDYSTYLDDNIEPFKCSCGAINCRGIISGKRKNEKW